MDIKDTDIITKEQDEKYSYIGDFHTHGLSKYNNQRELCVVLALDKNKIKTLLNDMSLRVASNKTIFTEGIRTDILNNGMDVQFLSLDNDPVLYVILPDPNGKLPSDDDCKEPYKFQYEYAKRISENKYA